MSEYVLVTDYLEDFCEALRDQLVEDEERWGDEWLKRPREGQATRIYDRIHQYRFQQDVPWLKIAGNALIGWIRDTYPELSEHWQ